MKSVAWHCLRSVYHKDRIFGLVQNCSISSALAMEILQFCTKPSTCRPQHNTLLYLGVHYPSLHLGLEVQLGDHPPHNMVALFILVSRHCKMFRNKLLFVSAVLLCVAHEWQFVVDWGFSFYTWSVIHWNGILSFCRHFRYWLHRNLPN